MGYPAISEDVGCAAQATLSSLQATSAPPHELCSDRTVSFTPVVPHVETVRRRVPIPAFVYEYHTSRANTPPGSQLAVPSIVALNRVPVVVPAPMLIAPAQLSFSGGTGAAP